jgi:hypothetical protein
MSAIGSKSVPGVSRISRSAAEPIGMSSERLSAAALPDNPTPAEVTIAVPDSSSSLRLVISVIRDSVTSSRKYNRILV